jgi:hypothetical protein
MYELVAKDGEIISRRHANSMEDAVRIFSIIKNLDADTLLSLYGVVCAG